MIGSKALGAIAALSLSALVTLPPAAQAGQEKPTRKRPHKALKRNVEKPREEGQAWHRKSKATLAHPKRAPHELALEFHVNKGGGKYDFSFDVQDQTSGVKAMLCFSEEKCGYTVKADGGEVTV